MQYGVFSRRNHACNADIPAACTLRSLGWPLFAREQHWDRISASKSSGVISNYTMPAKNVPSLKCLEKLQTIEVAELRSCRGNGVTPVMRRVSEGTEVQRKRVLRWNRVTIGKVRKVTGHRGNG